MRARLTLGKEDLQRTEEIAASLTRHGFRVENVRAASLSLEGSKPLFESVFHCQVEATEGSIQLDKQPEIPEEMGGDDATLYFPRAPEFFP